jgi:glyoxylate/hydroxypyruvate reductase
MVLDPNFQFKSIFAAGIDIISPELLPVDHPLFKLDNCIVLHHIASATNDTRDKMGLLAADNIIKVPSNQPMPKEILI